MSGRFPDGSLGSSLWGHLAVAATGVEESHGQRSSPSSFLKCSSVFLLGTVFLSSPPHTPRAVALAEDQTTGLEYSILPQPPKCWVSKP